MCKYCEIYLTNGRKLEFIKVSLQYKFHDSEAYGYPDVAYYYDDYELNYCPLCGKNVDKET